MAIGRKIEVLIDSVKESLGMPKFKLGQKLRFDFVYGAIRTKGCVIENAILYNEKGKREGCLDLLEKDFEVMAGELLEGEKIFIYYGTDHMEDTDDADRLAYIVRKGMIHFAMKDQEGIDFAKVIPEKFPMLSASKSIIINNIPFQEAEKMVKKARN